jgi:hypothetical protein
MMKRQPQGLLWFWIVLILSGQAAFAYTSPLSSVTLAWTASTSMVAGYRIHDGVASQTYTNVVDVGDVTVATVSGLTPGVQYFFAVTAYDSTGLESPFSSEVSYVPGSPRGTDSTLQLTINPSSQLQLTGIGPAGYTYDLQASKDMKTWTSIGRVTNDATGLFQFTDRDNLTGGQKFYRLRQTTP